MRKVYTLSTCDTSKRILKPLNLDKFTVKDIKKERITPAELEAMYVFSGSYESLFSRRSRSFAAIKGKQFSESDYKSLILDDYTFLKRPVIIDGDQIFIGNQKKNIVELHHHFGIE